VFLYRINGTDTTAVDSHAYATAEVADNRAVGRLPGGTGEWVVFDGLNPYTGSPPPASTGCLPSPGAATDCVTPVEKASWGRVKTEYSKRSQ
jgi:hypothetical protein